MTKYVRTYFKIMSTKWILYSAVSQKISAVSGWQRRRAIVNLAEKVMVPRKDFFAKLQVFSRTEKGMSILENTEKALKSNNSEVI